MHIKSAAYYLGRLLLMYVWLWKWV